MYFMQLISVDTMNTLSLVTKLHQFIRNNWKTSLFGKRVFLENESFWKMSLFEIQNLIFPHNKKTPTNLTS
jgi:hypothetical protein